MKALIIIKFITDRIYEVARVLIAVQIGIHIYMGNTSPIVFLLLGILIFTQLVEINSSIKSSHNITAMSISGDEMMDMMKGHDDE